MISIDLQLPVATHSAVLCIKQPIPLKLSEFKYLIIIIIVNNLSRLHCFFFSINFCEATECTFIYRLNIGCMQCGKWTQPCLLLDLNCWENLIKYYL